MLEKYTYIFSLILDSYIVGMIGVSEYSLVIIIVLFRVLSDSNDTYSDVMKVVCIHPKKRIQEWSFGEFLHQVY